jgi:hypothetical protein
VLCIITYYRQSVVSNIHSISYCLDALQAYSLIRRHVSSNHHHIAADADGISISSPLYYHTTTCCHDVVMPCCDDGTTTQQQVILVHRHPTSRYRTKHYFRYHHTDIRPLINRCRVICHLTIITTLLGRVARRAARLSSVMLPSSSNYRHCRGQLAKAVVVNSKLSNEASAERDSSITASSRRRVTSIISSVHFRYFVKIDCHVSTVYH